MAKVTARRIPLPPTRCCTLDGFSLVEVMVAMTLGLVVIAGIAQIYVGGRDTQQIVDTNAALSEKARFALEFFAHDLRMAGYFTCGGDQADVANALNPGSYWLQVRGIDGIDGGNGTHPVANLPAPFEDLPTPLPGSDVLVVRYADVRSRVPIGADDADPSQNQFNLDLPHRLVAGDVVVVNGATCAQTTIFQITGLPLGSPDTSISYDASSADVTPGNCTNDLAGDYTCDDLATSRALIGDEYAGGELAKLLARAFFVATPPAEQCTPTGQQCPAIQDCPTLYIAGSDVTGAVAVLRDVVGMQVVYGIDDDLVPDVDRYVSADSLISDDDWSNIISIRITLQMIRSDCSPVNFTNTVALRNQSVLLGTAQ